MAALTRRMFHRLTHRLVFSGGRRLRYSAQDPEPRLPALEALLSFPGCWKRSPETCCLASLRGMSDLLVVQKHSRFFSRLSHNFQFLDFTRFVNQNSGILVLVGVDDELADIDG